MRYFWWVLSIVDREKHAFKTWQLLVIHGLGWNSKSPVCENLNSSFFLLLQVLLISQEEIKANTMSLLGNLLHPATRWKPDTKHCQQKLLCWHKSARLQMSQFQYNSTGELTFKSTAQQSVMTCPLDYLRVQYIWVYHLIDVMKIDNSEILKVVNPESSSQFNIK